MQHVERLQRSKGEKVMFFLGLIVGIITVVVIGIALIYDAFMNNKL
jgi:hypothetical protein